jgi:hypothetical protein
MSDVLSDTASESTTTTACHRHATCVPPAPPVNLASLLEDLSDPEADQPAGKYHRLIEKLRNQWLRGLLHSQPRFDHELRDTWAAAAARESDESIYIEIKGIFDALHYRFEGKDWNNVNRTLSPKSRGGRPVTDDELMLIVHAWIQRRGHLAVHHHPISGRGNGWLKRAADDLTTPLNIPMDVLYAKLTKFWDHLCIRAPTCRHKKHRAERTATPLAAHSGACSSADE